MLSLTEKQTNPSWYTYLKKKAEVVRIEGRGMQLTRVKMVSKLEQDVGKFPSLFHYATDSYNDDILIIHLDPILKHLLSSLFINFASWFLSCLYFFHIRMMDDDMIVMFAMNSPATCPLVTKD